MKEILEKLWDEYLSDKCAYISTEEESNLAKVVASLHEEINTMLNQEQQKAIERYIDAIYDNVAFFSKKAFFSGCKFSVSFFLEAMNL